MAQYKDLYSNFTDLPSDDGTSEENEHTHEVTSINNTTDSTTSNDTSKVQ